MGMMSFLHTADLHLSEKGDDRWQALGTIVDVAHQQDVKVFVISGDLFDSNADAELLRVDLRSIFEDAEFQTIIIPGNHDAEAYTAGLHFGKDVHVLRDSDWSKNVVDKDDVRFIGIPFEVMEAQEFRRRLRASCDLVDHSRINILLYHGELLDVSFDPGSFGPETGRYMPSRLAFFEELGVDYVLAGHFHTTFDVRTIGEGGFFVYPGSPVSITRREVGKRHAALIEIGKAPVPIPLDTHHFERVEITLNAFSEDEPLKVVKKGLNAVDPTATALLSVDGTIRGSEEQLAEAIKAELAGLSIEAQEFTFRDLSRVVEHPVFAEFEEYLSSLDFDKEKSIDNQEAEQLRALVIQAMSEAGL